MSSTTDEGTTRYRIRRYYLYLGVIYFFCFSAFGIGSVVTALWNTDGDFLYPIETAIFYGVFWSFFVLLSVWFILSYYRDVLELAANKITYLGVIQKKSFDISEVTHVEWRCVPVGGMVIVRTATNKLKIHLQNFTTDERQAIITFFHDTFSLAIQKNWHEFEKNLEMEKRPRVRSKAVAVVCALLLFSFSGVFVHQWLDGLGTEWLVVAIAIGIGALSYLWRVWLHVQRSPRVPSA